LRQHGWNYSKGDLSLYYKKIEKKMGEEEPEVEHMSRE
jgi:hypothetical protein